VAGNAAAQRLSIVVPKAGACSVAVRILRPLETNQIVRLELTGNGIGEKTPESANLVTFSLAAPLQLGDSLTVHIEPSQDSTSEDQVTVTEKGIQECKDFRLNVADERKPLVIEASYGQMFDNFSPAESGHYAANVPSTNRSRHTFGTDLQARVWRSPDRRRQLWLGGQFVYGVRTGDVDCRAEDLPPVCEQFLDGKQLPDFERAVYIMEHATSFEGFFRPRFEFVTVEASEEHRGVIYATAVFGVLMLDDGSNRAAGAHHAGAGIAATGGSFEGTYFEAGLGKTDLFIPSDNPPSTRQSGHWNRLKLDFNVMFSPMRAFADRVQVWRKFPRIAIRIRTDFDFQSADADSIQGYIGIQFPISELLKW
jgi:hypothetical protein